MLKRLLLVFAAFAFIILFTACSGGANNTTQPINSPTEEAAMDPVYKTISPADAKELIGNEDVILVDVRTQEEYEQGHIPKAILLPVDDIELKAGDILPDKDSVIIVYCRTGRRSEIAANELLGMGYKNVYDLGGIVDWPYETSTP